MLLLNDSFEPHQHIAEHISQKYDAIRFSITVLLLIVLSEGIGNFD